MLPFKGKTNSSPFVTPAFAFMITPSPFVPNDNISRAFKRKSRAPLLRPSKCTEEIPERIPAQSRAYRGNRYCHTSHAHARRFTKLSIDITESAPRFREWFDSPTPELEKLPLDWRDLDKRPFLKLLVVRCLRPDRLTQVDGALAASGNKYTW